MYVVYFSPKRISALPSTTCFACSRLVVILFVFCTLIFLSSCREKGNAYGGDNSPPADGMQDVGGQE